MPKIKSCKKNNSLSKENLPSWDLTDLYTSIKDPQIDKDLTSYKKQAIEFSKKYKSKIAKLSAKEFVKMAKTNEERSVLGNKIGVFAYLSMVTQMKNMEVMTFYQNIKSRS